MSRGLQPQPGRGKTVRTRLKNSVRHRHAPATVKRRSALTPGFLCFSLAVSLAWLGLCGAALAQQTDLTRLSIEDLMNLEVTSVAKKETRLLESPAAVFVITQEDLRRSGVTSVPDALRMVPGINVAQIDGSMWAISCRGFNNQFSNKLLVLVDGRTVYSPLYSGVYWDVQDLLLEDIERIEIIRGPGAALWGANAVNGVINIITKAAQDTQGGLLTTGGSTTEQRFAATRYGYRLPGKGFFRVFTKYLRHDGLAYSDGQRSADQADLLHGGFRAERPLSPRDSIAWQGDLYQGTLGQHVDLPELPTFLYSANESVPVEGGNLLARWRRVNSPRSDFSLQAYFDTTRREELLLGQRISTFDLEWQHHLRLRQRHDAVWGLGYRGVSDRLRGSPTATFVPDHETTNLFSGFLQDEIGLYNRRLRLTLGSKFEHYDFTGFEIQPTARLWLALTPHHHLWAAVSRAVRTPSAAEREVRAKLLVAPLPDDQIMVVDLIGSPDLVSEKMLSYEAGYRVQLGSRLSLDLAEFYSVYHRLTSVALSPPFPEMTPLPPHLVVPVTVGDDSYGHTYGSEVALNLNITDFWRISAADTWLRIYSPSLVSAQPGVGSLGAAGFGGESPEQQLNARSSFSFAHRLELDAAAYYVSRLVQQQVPGYTRLDLRLGWKPTQLLEFSLGGQNLLADHHPEYRAVYVVTPTEVRRNVYVKAVWRF